MADNPPDRPNETFGRSKYRNAPKEPNIQKCLWDYIVNCKISQITCSGFFKIMRKNISFPKDVEDSIADYRYSRGLETGETLHREAAIVELLRIALSRFEPTNTVAKRLGNIENRLLKLEEHDG